MVFNQADIKDTKIRTVKMRENRFQKVKITVDPFLRRMNQ